MSLFHQNQIDAAMRIVEGFKVGSNYTMLLAQMQSGKSDTYMLVGAELVRHGLVSQFVVFSGNAETALRDQAKNQKDFWRKYRRFLRKIDDDDDVTAERIEDTWSDDSVIWSNDLLRYEPKGGKTLFIWDESHFAQTGPTAKLVKGNRPCQFFQKFGLCADGSPNRDGHLMLSVSATPFSEVIVNEAQNQPKNVVCMVPGPTYRGLRQMIADHQIVPFKANGRWSELESKFKELAVQVKDDGVGIVRATGGKVDDLVKFCKSVDVNYIVHDIGDSTDINKHLATHNGVIIVKGKVKMGKQIQKQRIKWCMETTVSPNTDTLLQSLLGRCMGYPSSSGAHGGIKIYVSEKFWNTGEAQRYIDMMEYYETDQHLDSAAAAEVVVPEHAMNVKRGASPTACSVPAGPHSTSTTLYRTIPDKINLNLSEWDGTREDLTRLICDLFNGDQLRTRNDTKYVKHMLAGGAGKVGRVTLSSFEKNSAAIKKDFRGELGRCATSQRVLRDPGSSLGCGPTEVKVWHNLKNKGFIGQIQKFKEAKKPLACFLQYLSLTRPKTVLPDTTLKEVFSNQTEAGDEVLQNGGYIAGLKIETATDPAAMCAALIECVRHSKTKSELSYPCEVNSNYCSGGKGYKGITISNEIYEQLKPSGAIYEECKKNGAILKLSLARGKKPTDPFWRENTRLTRISW